jgi:hypothetical protein
MAAVSLMANFEARGANRAGERRFVLFSDVRAQLALVYAFEETPDFFRCAANLHLNTAVRQIFDPSDHIEAFGNVTHGPAETHSLDATFEENFN